MILVAQLDKYITNHNLTIKKERLTMSLRELAVLLLVLVFFAPGVRCIGVSISGNQGGSSFSDTTVFNAKNDERVSVHSIVNGGAMTQDARGNGNLHKSFTANNHRGEKAQVIADIVDAGSWDYSLPFIYTGDMYAGVSGFLLTAIDADSIECTSKASDRLGDKASASTEVHRGSLYNYQADAYSTSGGVQASQSFGGADGVRVEVKEKASNPTGSASTTTTVKTGGINGYSDYINDGTFANPELVETIGTFDHAAGKEIRSESSAHRKPGYRSNDKLDVAGTNSYLCYLDGFSSAAQVGFDGSETGVTQQISGLANGGTIGISSTSSNAERDTSSLNTEIRGTRIQPGFISGYSDLTMSFRDSVFASDYIDSANGNLIELSSSSSNKDKDRAKANMNAFGHGQIMNYEGSSNAATKIAFASNNLVNGNIAGKRIGFDVSASDFEGNRVIMSSKAPNGSLSGTLSSSSDISADRLIASQVGNEVSGSSIEAKLCYRVAAIGETGQFTFWIPDPSHYFITAILDKSNDDTVQ